MRLTAVLASGTILLSACGGGGANVAPSAPTSHVAITTRATVVVRLDGNTRAASRRRAFTSPSTAGLLVRSYASGSATVAGSAAVDFSAPGTCSTQPNSIVKSCTFAIDAPAGSDDFTFTGYDAAPSGGTFPTTANALGTATVRSVTVNVGATTTIATTLGGIVSKVIFAVPGLVDGSLAGTFAIAVTALDADGNIILTDDYATPISLSLTERGAGTSPHTTIAVNGGTPGASGTIARSSDTLALAYDGKGTVSPVYSANLAATSGAASGNADFAPVLVEKVPDASGVTYKPATPTGTNATLRFDDAFESVGLRFAKFGASSLTLTPDFCAGIVTGGTPQGTPSNGIVQTFASQKYANVCGLKVAVNGGPFEDITVVTTERLYAATSRINTAAAGATGGLGALVTYTPGDAVNPPAPTGASIAFPTGAYGVVEDGVGNLAGYAFDGATSQASILTYAHGAGSTTAPAPLRTLTAPTTSAPYAVVAGYLGIDARDTIYLNARNKSVYAWTPAATGAPTSTSTFPSLQNVTATTATSSLLYLSDDSGVTGYPDNPLAAMPTASSTIAYAQPANPQIRAVALNPAEYELFVGHGSTFTEYYLGAVSSVPPVTFTLPSLGGQPAETVSAIAVDSGSSVEVAGYVPGTGGAPAAPGHLYRFRNGDATTNPTVSTSTTPGIVYQLTF